MKIVFFDIDGTLYDNTTKSIPETTKKALKILKEKGLIIVICTGRAKYNINVIKEIEEYIDYYIFSNGAHITDSNYIDVLLRNIPKDTVINLQNDFKKDRIVYGLQGKDNECISRRTKRVIKLMNDCSLPLPKTNKNYVLNYPVLQLWCLMSEKKVINYINKYKDFSFLKWNKNCYDVIYRNITKGQAVKYLLDNLNINKNEAISFGDSENDISMFKETTYSVCLGNGLDNVLRASTFISKRIEEEGVYKALEFYNLI